MNIEKYRNKRLTVDEVSLVKNEIDKQIEELENFNYETGNDHLLLKWGTLKSWNFNSEIGKALLKEYFEIGSSASAMMQKDTNRQKELICKLIDECDGIIQEDLNGKYLTKKEAKKYVIEYN